MAQLADELGSGNPTTIMTERTSKVNLPMPLHLDVVRPFELACWPGHSDGLTGWRDQNEVFLEYDFSSSFLSSSIDCAISIRCKFPPTARGTRV